MAQDDPATGMYMIGKSLVWHNATLVGSGKAFSWARVGATTWKDGNPKVVTITLIAGSNGKPTIGVEPPLKTGEVSRSGLEIEHCFPSRDGGTSEVVTLHRGFMCVTVEAGESQKDHVVPWPFIIRSHAIPAGAYSTDFVLLDINKEDGCTRAYAFRPNQKSFKPGTEAKCESAATPDWLSTIKVYAHPYNGAILEMTETSYVALESGQAAPTAPTMPIDPNSPESKFLIDTCEFYKQAMTVVNGGVSTGVSFLCNTSK